MSLLSHKEESFDIVSQLYNKKMEDAGSTDTFKYTPTTKTRKKKARQANFVFQPVPPQQFNSKALVIYRRPALRLNNRVLQINWCAGVLDRKTSICVGLASFRKEYKITSVLVFQRRHMWHSKEICHKGESQASFPVIRFWTDCTFQNNNKIPGMRFHNRQIQAISTVTYRAFQRLKSVAISDERKVVCSVGVFRQTTKFKSRIFLMCSIENY